MRIDSKSSAVALIVAAVAAVAFAAFYFSMTMKVEALPNESYEPAGAEPEVDLPPDPWEDDKPQPHGGDQDG